MSLKSSLPPLLTLAFLVLVLGCFVMAKRVAANERWQEAEAHLVTFKESLQSDAQAMIDAWRDEERAGVVDRDMIPMSLAVPGLRQVEVREEHVNLVVYKSPDVKSGFRLWVAPVSEDYRDQPTSIPFVQRFLYLDERPSSPSNRP